MTKNNFYNDTYGFGISGQRQYVPAGTAPMPQGEKAVPRVGDEPACNPGRGCGAEAGSKWGITGRPVGTVYAPLQNFENIYSPAEGFPRGTIFAALDLPFAGASGCGCAGGGRRRG